MSISLHMLGLSHTADSEEPRTEFVICKLNKLNEKCWRHGQGAGKDVAGSAKQDMLLLVLTGAVPVPHL